MNFRLQMEPKRSVLTLRPEKPLLLLGSCFADNMAAKMRASLWNADNPLGVLFNPQSIAENLRLCIDDEHSETEFERSIVVKENEVFSWLADSSANGQSKEEVINRLINRQKRVKTILNQNPTACITFGTAFAYFLTARPGFIVANCHKQPSVLFNRRALTVSEIVDIWNPLLNRLKEKYDRLQIIFTVSPVRHVRDGLHENTLSKSILHLAVDEICRTHNFCHYFPAYELLIDDLRDYRFYANDMAHPSELAVNYIWENFKTTYLDEEGKRLLEEGERLAKRVTHRHILPGSSEAKKFDEQTNNLLADFHRRYPGSLLPLRTGEYEC